MQKGKTRKLTNSHTPHESLHSPLTSTVNSMPWHPLRLPRDTAHHDQPPPLLQPPIRLPPHKELPTRVCVKDAVILFLRDVPHVSERNDPAVGADDVEFPEVGDGLAEQGDDLGDFGHVGLDGDGVGAGPAVLDQGDDVGSGAGGVGVVHHDAGATTAELEGHGAANAATCKVRCLLSCVGRYEVGLKGCGGTQSERVEEMGGRGRRAK